VIIDDFMPLINGTTFPFVQTPNDNKELWPILIEKAYAKKYGSYGAIAGGLVDFALAELTNGIPETMEKADNQNLEKWWTQLI
jgi:calpain